MEWLAAGAIPISYEGVDISRVMDRVEGVKREFQGRFEKTADFEKRQAEAMSAVMLVRGVRLYDILAMPAVERTGPARSMVAVDYRYDPDKEQFQVAMRSSDNAPTKTSAAPQPLYPLDLQLERSVVDKDGPEQEMPAVFEYATLGTLTNKLGDVHLAMSIDEAKREVPHLRTLVFAQIISPKVAKTSQTDYMVTHKRRVLPVLYKGFVVYSGLTGKILGTYPKGMDKDLSLMSTVSGATQD